MGPACSSMTGSFHLREDLLSTSGGPYLPRKANLPNRAEPCPQLSVLNAGGVEFHPDMKVGRKIIAARVVKPGWIECRSWTFFAHMSAPP